MYLGVEGNDNTLLLANPVKQEAAEVKVVTGLNADAGSNLVLPLARKNLSK